MPKVELRYRLTDRILQAEYGINPLSVSSDKVAVLAWRCAELLDEISAAGMGPSRDGTDGIVEVYPGAALKVWDLKHRSTRAVAARRRRRSANRSASA